MTASIPNVSDLPVGDAHLREHTASSVPLVSGDFLQLVRDQVHLPTGLKAQREYLLHPGAVMVVALLDDGRVLLERQYRHPVGLTMLELPAGKLDAGEDVLVCAARELREETGCTATHWAVATAMHPCIGYSNEVIHVVFAKGIVRGEQALDEGELLDVCAATPAALLAMAAEGRITDGKTLAGLLWLQNVSLGAWTLDWQAAV
jgi:ADP-ribose pyrophosphatase